jgi:flagellin
MLSLHTNAAALSTQNSLGLDQQGPVFFHDQAGHGLPRQLRHGRRSRPADRHPPEAQTRGMSVAQKNTQNGISMLQTAEGALAEVNNMILRMKDLATEAANATSTDADKTAMQAEFTALSAEITTSWPTPSSVARHCSPLQVPSLPLRPSRSALRTPKPMRSTLRPI